jgi:hypothetical protein
MEKLKKALTGIVTLTSFLVLAMNTHVLPVNVPDQVIKWVAGCGMFVALFAKSVLGWIILPGPTAPVLTLTPEDKK